MTGNEKEIFRKQVISFILTLILVPMIYVGTCYPVGFLSVLASNELVAIPISAGLYSLIFIILAIYKAKRTQNKGVKYGIISVLIISILTLSVLIMLKELQ